MSLNRYEQTIFNYWQTQVDERRHWQAKVAGLAKVTAEPGTTARDLERELWDYFVERSASEARFKQLSPDGVRRVSLLNLAEYLLRLWGPPTNTKNSRSSQVSLKDDGFVT